MCSGGLSIDPLALGGVPRATFSRPFQTYSICGAVSRELFNQDFNQFQDLFSRFRRLIRLQDSSGLNTTIALLTRDDIIKDGEVMFTAANDNRALEIRSVIILRKLRCEENARHARIPIIASVKAVSKINVNVTFGRRVMFFMILSGLNGLTRNLSNALISFMTSKLMGRIINREGMGRTLRRLCVRLLRLLTAREADRIINRRRIRKVKLILNFRRLLSRLIKDISFIRRLESIRVTL